MPKPCILTDSVLDAMSIADRAWVLLRHRDSGSCEEDEAQQFFMELLHYKTCAADSCFCYGGLPWSHGCGDEYICSGDEEWDDKVVEEQRLGALFVAIGQLVGGGVASGSER